MAPSPNRWHDERVSSRESSLSDPDVHVRTRVSIAYSDPEIWRLLELDASLTLDRVHQILQVAFQWRDAHLHSFSNEDPYAPSRQRGALRLIPRRWISQDLVDDGHDGQLETETTLGQALASASGVLFYEYDFGDSWLHHIELIEVFDSTDDPSALLLRGARRGPLEDSGGISGYTELMAILADPSRGEHPESSDWVSYILGPWQSFDADAVNVDDINRKLRRLVEPVASASLVDRLAERIYSGVRGEFRSYLAGSIDGPATVDTATAERMLRPYSWLLHRIGVDGLQLTAAGWLPPTVVRDAMRELEWEWRWIGAMNREDQTVPILELRASAQRMGLIRKLKGRLVLNAAAKRVLGNPDALWSMLATSLALRHRSEAVSDAALLLAIEVASGRRSTRPDYLDPIAFGLGALGWTTRDGENLPMDTVSALVDETWDVFHNLGAFVLGASRHGVTAVTDEGRAFARAILRV